MAESREDISGLVETLVLPLVDEPDAVSIESSDTEMGSVLIEVRVAQADAKRIVSRQVVVIKAIRTLARAAGSRHGLDVEVELIDE